MVEIDGNLLDSSGNGNHGDADFVKPNELDGTSMAGCQSAFINWFNTEDFQK